MEMNKFAVAFRHKRDKELFTMYIYTSEETSEFKILKEVQYKLDNDIQPKVGANSMLISFCKNYEPITARRLYKHWFE